ncbi:MAG: glycosyltransferase family 87 protein [Pseudomonadota bacterium]
MFKLQKSTIFVLKCLFVLFALSIVFYGVMEFAFPQFMQKPVLLDFDAFHLTGKMISEGKLADAYNSEMFKLQQHHLPGAGEGVLYWSYPPPYNLLAAALGSLPIWLSYALFISVSLGLYVTVARALAGRDFFLAIIPLITIFPLIIRSGQNGFLTGALIGLTCLLILRKSSFAGVPLGMMVLKPHLAVGVAAWSLLNRKWRMVASAAVTVFILCLLTTAVFGFDVWFWFFSAIETTQLSLREGAFPLFRMSSVFAFGLSIGMDLQSAILLHVLGVVTAICALVVLLRSVASPRVGLGASVFVSALLSPYSYDYDLAMLGIAACLLGPLFIALASELEKSVLVAVSWMLGFYGLSISFLKSSGFLLEVDQPISITGPGLFIIGAMVFRILYTARLQENRTNHLVGSDWV